MMPGAILVIWATHLLAGVIGLLSCLYVPVVRALRLQAISVVPTGV
jgi:hypothetical protein